MQVRRLPYFKWIFKTICALIIIAVIAMAIHSWISEDSTLVRTPQNLASSFLNIKKKFKEVVPNEADKKDWHDYQAMQRDARRVGIGEDGRPAYLKKKVKLKEAHKLLQVHGFNALLSDIISVNRSVPDIRFVGCRKKKYLVNLPRVSVIMPFHNEHFSTLVRSIHSVVNRTPPELLKEIILVDDLSDHQNLFQKLDQYIAKHFPKIVDILRFSKRKGLIAARIAGALKSTGSVLVFMDSHIETNYNWLPPLLEPIVLDKHTAVCPFIDVIDDKNFKYTAQDEGARGAFDWKFDYKRLPLLPRDLRDRTKPFPNPIMAGGLFAISKEWFWDLGGYDEGLDIWGGEQYELSFKIWMCGGRILDAPCSRVAHIYRGPQIIQENPRDEDYLAKNFKRVAEVWMDEYKEFLYDRVRGALDNVNPGDLREQKALREKLHCKSFKWFMENVAFDLVKKYPPSALPDYAYGALRPVKAPELCLDTLGLPKYQRVGLRRCGRNLKQPQRNQNWALSWYKDLRMRGEMYCLDINKPRKNAPVMLMDCHKRGDSQFWYYDRKNQWLRQSPEGKRCLMAAPKKQTVLVNPCSKKNPYLKWTFAVLNNTALDLFDDNL